MAKNIFAPETVGEKNQVLVGGAPGVAPQWLPVGAPGQRLTVTPDGAGLHWETPEANEHFRGLFEDILDVPAPSSGSWETNLTPEPNTPIINGDYVLVGGVGIPAAQYLADLTDDEWVPVGGGGGGSTLDAAQVKALYESNPNTNAFTDTNLDNLQQAGMKSFNGSSITYPGYKGYKVNDINDASNRVVVTGATENSVLPSGSVGQVLKSGGAGVNPTWGDAYVSKADAVPCGNLTLGSGSVPRVPTIEATTYPANTIVTNAGSGKMHYIANGSAGQVLTSNGSAAPSWLPNPANALDNKLINNLSLSMSNAMSVKANPRSDPANRLVVTGDTANGVLGFGQLGYRLEAGGVNAPRWVSNDNIYCAATSSSAAALVKNAGTVTPAIMPGDGMVLLLYCLAGHHASDAATTGLGVAVNSTVFSVVAPISGTMQNVAANTIKVRQGGVMHMQFSNNRLVLLNYDELAEARINDVYSTSERLTSEIWIDAKPIYRKTIRVYLPNGANTQTTAHGISGLDTIVKAEGWVKAPSLGRFRPTHWTEASNATFRGMNYEFNATNITMHATLAAEGSTWTECYITVYYTKA
jgi:hypothetical protein